MLLLRRLLLPSALLTIAGCASRAPDRADSTGAVHAATTAAADTAPVAALPATQAPGTGSGVSYYTAAALADVADSLARTSASGHRLGERGAFQYLVIRRPKSGVPEVHDRWADVTVVQAGRGTLVSGGQVRGSHPEPDGEHRGGTIEGGTSRPVGPGDLMIIPAGVPHQYLLARGDSLRYLTVKVQQPAAPR